MRLAASERAGFGQPQWSHPKGFYVGFPTYSELENSCDMIRFPPGKESSNG